MHKILMTILGVSVFSAAALTNDEKINEAQIGAPLPVSITIEETGMGNLDFAQSTFSWEGRKFIGDGHTGTIDIKSNSFLIGTHEKLTSGVIILNMDELVVTDLSQDLAPKLAAHLKSDDFFEVDRYPTIKVEIVELNKNIPENNVLNGATHLAIGNLHIKDVVKSIQFPVIVKYNGPEAIIDGTVALDRTEFGINYGRDESLKDKLIEKNVILRFHISGTLSQEDDNQAVDVAE